MLSYLNIRNILANALAKMNWLTANVRDFRSVEKCCSISVSFLLLIVLLSSSELRVAAAATGSATTSSSHAASDAVGVAGASDELLFDSFDDGGGDADVAEEFANADNVEWHHVKIVDGVMREDHPVVMYKEDFVSEDFDPTKNSTSEGNDSSHSPETSHAHSHAHSHRRKYSDITHKRHRVSHTDTTKYRTLKPEKIYFDVLPEAPVVVSDETVLNDSKFDPLRVEAISLLDDEDTQQRTEEPSKQLLNKLPKKYHRRIRRDTSEHRHKRNPYYRHRAQVESENNIAELLKLIYGNYNGQHIASQLRRERHPVQGKLWNGISLIVETPPAVKPDTDTPDMSFENRFGGEDNTDRVVWRPTAGPNRNTPASTGRRPPISLFHDSNPKNADFGFIKQQEYEHSQQQGRKQQQPETGLQMQSIGKSARGGNTVGRQRVVNGNAQPKPNTAQQDISCKRATNSCCATRDLSMRHDCFMRLSCVRTIASIISLCD